MKINEKTRFPHPVLSASTGDYATGDFTIKVTGAEVPDKQEVALDFEVELTQPDIRALVESGAASVGLFVNCRDTFYSRFVPLGLGGGRFAFERGALLGRVTLRPMIWTQKPMRLKYLSNATIDALRDNVAANVDRYRSGDFNDMIAAGDWSIELDLEVDLAPLSGLDASGRPEAEIANSRLVWKVLSTLTPTLACEEGIWARLTHVECIGFARARWLRAEMDDETVVKTVEEHFFAPGLTARRDDNAISRLWWNAFVANSVTPGPTLESLDMILKKADIRSNIVERSATASRPALTAGIIRVMRRTEWVSGHEDNFRSFMKTLNRLGGGMVFECMPESDVDAFMDYCATRAGATTTEANQSAAG